MKSQCRGVDATGGPGQESHARELVDAAKTVGDMFPVDQVPARVDGKSRKCKEAGCGTEESLIELGHEYAAWIWVEAADDGVLER